MDSYFERYAGIAFEAWERYCAERGWDATSEELGGEFRVFCAGYASGVRKDMRAVHTEDSPK